MMEGIPLKEAIFDGKQLILCSNLCVFWIDKTSYWHFLYKEKYDHL